MTPCDWLIAACDCENKGVSTGAGVCNPITGQCFCKPNVRGMWKRAVATSGNSFSIRFKLIAINRGSHARAISYVIICN